MSTNATECPVDTETWEIINREHALQLHEFDMVASENYTSKAVRRALSSVFTNKYAEGLPDERSYAGIENCNAVENLCLRRLREVFKVPGEYSMTVQPLSGGPANLALICAVVPKGGKVLFMDERDGGHFTHGGAQHILRSTYSFCTYRAGQDGLFSLEALRAAVERENPDLVIIGASEIVSDYPYAEIRAACGTAHVHADISHIAGLIAAGLMGSPFPFVDSLASTTHKTLRGPRGGILIYKDKSVFASLFPGFQAGPHVNAIAALSVALFEAQTEDFRQYARNLVANAQAMQSVFEKRGFHCLSQQTITHQVIVEVMHAEQAAERCKQFNIIVNPCYFCGSESQEKNALRIGSPMLTSLRLTQDDFREVAQIISDVIQGHCDGIKQRMEAIYARFRPDDE